MGSGDIPNGHSCISRSPDYRCSDTVKTACDGTVVFIQGLSVLNKLNWLKCSFSIWDLPQIVTIIAPLFTSVRQLLLGIYFLWKVSKQTTLSKNGHWYHSGKKRRQVKALWRSRINSVSWTRIQMCLLNPGLLCMSVLISVLISNMLNTFESVVFNVFAASLPFVDTHWIRFANTLPKSAGPKNKHFTQVEVLAGIVVWLDLSNS